MGLPHHCVQARAMAVAVGQRPSCGSKRDSDCIVCMVGEKRNRKGRGRWEITKEAEAKCLCEFIHLT